MEQVHVSNCINSRKAIKSMTGIVTDNQSGERHYRVCSFTQFFSRLPLSVGLTSEMIDISHLTFPRLSLILTASFFKECVILFHTFPNPPHRSQLRMHSRCLLGAQNFTYGAARSFSPLTTVLHKPETNAPQRAKEHFVRCKAERLVSFNSDSQTSLSSIKAAFQNFCPPHSYGLRWSCL